MAEKVLPEEIYKFSGTTDLKPLYVARITEIDPTISAEYYITYEDMMSTEVSMNPHKTSFSPDHYDAHKITAKEYTAFLEKEQVHRKDKGIVQHDDYIASQSKVSTIPWTSLPMNGWVEDATPEFGRFLAHTFGEDYKEPGINGYAWNSSGGAYWITGTTSQKRSVN